MNEIWKPTKENGQCYEVSSLGRVRTVGFNNGWGYYRRKKPLVMRQRLMKNGYKTVMLNVDGKHKPVLVHRLVANNFIGDLGDLVVNHKDGNKQNNVLENLEICTISQNMTHAYRVLGIEHSRKGKRGRYVWKSKPVRCLDGNGNVLAEYESIRLAADTLHCPHCSISEAARAGRRCRGYYWQFTIDKQQ